MEASSTSGWRAWAMDSSRRHGLNRKKQARILGVLGTVVGVLIIALILVPILFRDRIVARVKAAVNGAVAARVDWRDAGLSLFVGFPNLTLRLDDVTVA